MCTVAGHHPLPSRTFPARWLLSSQSTSLEGTNHPPPRDAGRVWGPGAHPCTHGLTLELPQLPSLGLIVVVGPQVGT